MSIRLWAALAARVKFDASHWNLTDVLSQENLLKVIDDDLRVCREAENLLHPKDTLGRRQKNLESRTLMMHLQWAQQAGTDQGELEKVVRSLETHPVLRRYRNWRKRSETKSV